MTKHNLIWDDRLKQSPAINGWYRCKFCGVMPKSIVIGRFGREEELETKFCEEYVLKSVLL